MNYLKSILKSTGVLVLLGLTPIVLVLTYASAELAPLQAAAVVVALGVSALGAGALLAPLARRLARSPRRAWWEAGLMAVVFLHLGWIGVYLYRTQLPALAWVGPVVLAGLMFVRFAQMPAAWRGAVVRGVRGLAAGAALVPLLAAPVVVPAAAADRPQPFFTPLDPDTLQARPEAPPLVLLVSFDALRARSLGDLSRLPHFAALARESTWFTNCRAASDRTLASVPAMLSGAPASALLAPIRNRSGLLPARAVPTVAGYLRRAGYRASYATMLVSPEVYGMAGEFDGGLARLQAFPRYFRQSGSWLGLGAVAADMPRLLRMVPADSPPDATRAVLRHTESELGADGRKFHWLHLGVPHGPYYVFEPGAKAQLATWGDQPTFEDVSLVSASAEQSAAIEAAYEKYVEVADDALGELMRTLKASGRWDDALVIVTADHGESFAPGRPPHSYGGLPEDITHVPLFVHWPRQHQARRDDRLVSHEDLVPTILRTVFEPFASRFRGRPLDALPPGPRTVVASTTFDRLFFQAQAGELAAYRDRFKYVYDYGSATERLYDLAEDPSGQTDRIERHAALAAAMRRSLWSEIAQAPASLPPPIFPALPADGRIVGADAAHKAHFGRGWSWPEAWGRWSDAPEATIRFALPPGAAPTRLTLEGQRFDAPQTLTLTLNDRPLGRHVVRAGAGEAPERFGFEVAGRLRPEGNVLTVAIANPRSPRALGLSSDDRSLGFGLVALTLK